MKKERFGLELAAARTRRGFTQAELAEAVGVTERSISLWERGKVIPRPGIRMVLAQHLLGLDNKDGFLFDDELPETAAPVLGKTIEEEAGELQKRLQRALEEAQVSEELKRVSARRWRAFPPCLIPRNFSSNINKGKK